MFFLVGCTDRTLVLKDKLQVDTYYLDVRPNETALRGEGTGIKLMNFTDGSENLTFYEDVTQ
jgi:hypothetical protein